VVDQGAIDTRANVRESAAPARDTLPLPTTRRPRRRRLWVDLVLLGVVGVLLVAAAGAAVGSVYRAFYSPSAFAEHYLSLLAEGRAAEALLVPGVAVDTEELEAAGLPVTASDALLRRDAMATLSDLRVVSETADGSTVRVTVEYVAGDVPGTTTFEVVRDGSVGLAPTWRFAKSPLAVMELAVQGSMTFDVNGFAIDKRQVSPDGADADPLATIDLLMFSPGIYSVSVDTPISSTPGVAVLSDSPFASVAVQVQAEPTPEFVAVVQERVEEFLTACTSQEVLQPTACPFGYFVSDRIASPPRWSIVRQPAVTLLPEGAGWVVPAAPAMARIEVDVQSLFDGSIERVVEDIPFDITGTVSVLPDGTASIVLGQSGGG
jgi:hypothetical protein